jgi:hypothetical protein
VEIDAVYVNFETLSLAHYILMPCVKQPRFQNRRVISIT